MATLTSSMKVLFLLVAHADALRTNVSVRSTHSDFPIDAVYCWAGEVNNSAPKSHDTGGDFHELYYSLLSLEKNADWIRRVFVLVNGPNITLPDWAAQNGNVVMIDRCTLFPETEAKFCPTFNTHACQSVVHRVPGLSQHFLLLEDDFVALHPTTQSDFFADEKQPYNCYRPQNFTILYGTDPPKGPDMPPKQRPYTYKSWGNCHHTPKPMLVSFSRDLETEFRDWFAFVRSHTGRFTCCDRKLHADGLAEDFMWMYPAMMDKRNISIYKEVNENYVGCDQRPNQDYDAVEKLNHLITEPVKSTSSTFAVVNNCDTSEHATAAFDVVAKHLGKPSGRFVVDGIIPEIRVDKKDIGGCASLNMASLFVCLLVNVACLMINGGR